MLRKLVVSMEALLGVLCICLANCEIMVPDLDFRAYV